MTEHFQKWASPTAPFAPWASRVCDVQTVELEPRDPRAVSAVRGVMTIVDGGPLVPFESDLERRFLALLRFDRRVLRVRAQPFSLLFTDTASGSRRRYTPDFLVQFSESAGLPFKALLVEVKARRDLFRDRRRLRAPLAAARTWAFQAPDRAFHVITDKRMASGAWLRNADILSAHLDKRYEPAFLAQCLNLFDSARELQLRTVLERAEQRNLNHAAVLSGIYHLIARRVLDVELGVPISYESWLCLNEAAQQRP